MSQRSTLTLEGPHPFRGYDLRDGDHWQHVVLNLTQLERYDEAALLWRETVRLGEVLFRLALARWSPVSVYNLPSSHRPSFHRLLFHRLKVRSLSRCAECRHSHRGSSAQKLTRVRRKANLLQGCTSHVSEWLPTDAVCKLSAALSAKCSTLPKYLLLYLYTESLTFSLMLCLYLYFYRGPCTGFHLPEPLV
jgi:hypothetical protein